MKIDFFGKGLEKRLFTLAIAFILLSCQSSNQEKIKGDWYSFESDSTYFELYINDTMIVLNNENYGPVGYDYEVKGDKLFVSNSVGMERVWTMEEISSESMKLTDSLESLRYLRLDLGKSFFNSLSDSISFREFLEDYATRSAVHSKK
jgi:hypothetical protein